MGCMLKQDQSELQNNDVEKEDKAARDTVVEGVKGVRETGGVFADEEDVDTTEKIALVTGTADENVEENVLQECMLKQYQSELQNYDVEKEDKAAQDTVVEGVKGVRETGGVFADEEDVDTTEKIALVTGTADENVE